MQIVRRSLGDAATVTKPKTKTEATSARTNRIMKEERLQAAREAEEARALAEEKRAKEKALAEKQQKRAEEQAKKADEKRVAREQQKARALAEKQRAEEQAAAAAAAAKKAEEARVAREQQKARALAEQKRAAKNAQEDRVARERRGARLQSAPVGSGAGGALAYLQPLRLSEYASEFDNAGADTLDLLDGLTVADLMAQFNMTRIHANKLRKAVDKVSGFARGVVV